MDTTQSHNKPYHHGNLHDELLRIAVQLGKEKGPEAITIRAVTRAAGVSPTSAYRHFKDQEELHDKVAELATDELVRRLHRTTNEAGDLAFPDHLVQIGFAYLDFALDETNFFRCMLEWKALRFMLGVDPSTPDDPKSEHLNLIQRYFDLLARHAQALGQTPKKEYFLHNSLLSWSAVHGFTVLAIDGPCPSCRGKKSISFSSPSSQAACAEWTLKIRTMYMAITPSCAHTMGSIRH
ncbi:TetR/AcrR family transcriptional regulator [Corynebacterium accolens]|uniref:TetR/AcrR family transcriptional regulator n=1 Tax=Corynebacterium accolens TaxID=38284 RepID=UPI002550973D|nr:TetR/AcrR family transcriptional regulator [Corynebacterium accolens]MDK8470912.1 TetR/AcrR family transcriptional regulator [Corynebacterium accolens]MDK8616993.1 TetR/AcrR family transcriptional regulator [Corynebacterium accolens]WKS56023.1 TetR/AcrR family transcriptional regulator [Corynebacterium accolens]